MSPWWILWPLVGLLSWGWLNYMRPIKEDSAIEKMEDIFVCVVVAPAAAFLIVLIAICIAGPDRRWGLRFW